MVVGRGLLGGDVSLEVDFDVPEAGGMLSLFSFCLLLWDQM